MRTKAFCLAAAFMLVLTSCGGDGPGLAGSRGGGSQSPGGDGGDGGGGTGGNETTVVMGSTADGSFQQGTVGIGVTNLASGGSTSITVQLRTGDGAPYTESADITFSSDCQSSGHADIEETTVSTDIGTATTTYSDLGCAGSDTITARANVAGAVLTATGSLTVAAPELGSIEFVSAEPQTIGLRGTGAAGIRESSTVRFRVLNDVGGPMPDQEVRFALSTEVGGLRLVSDTATSGADGTASVIVRSGTVPTSVRITATVVGTNVATQSSGLTVSTAIPDQDSFSLSAETLNPEAWGYNGVEVLLTVHAADRFNNFIPDDTAIVFTTELGAIAAQCLTQNGTCTTTWRSQNPKIDYEGGHTGRTTILAHAVGEESFEDENGNGVFDGTKECSDPTLAAGEDCFYNMPEAWRDDNEDGDYDAPNEDFVDFDSADGDGDGHNYDGKNDRWDGIFCGEESCNANLTNVRESLVLVMARSAADILFFDSNGDAVTGTLGLPTTITACIAGEDTFEPTAPATLNDIVRAQTMPSGTTIDFSSTVGEVTGKTDWVVPSTSSDVARCHSYWINDGESGDRGLFEVSVTSPGGLETYGSISIQDTDAP